MGKTSCGRTRRMGELCVCYHHYLLLGEIHSSSQFFLGVKGREKQTVGEVYELFESVLSISFVFLP